MTSDVSADRDGSVLDYSRLHDMTIQTWSPFQMPNWQGCFINSGEYSDLNKEMSLLGGKYQVSATTVKERQSDLSESHSAAIFYIEVPAML